MESQNNPVAKAIIGNFLFFSDSESDHIFEHYYSLILISYQTTYLAMELVPKKSQM
jgi:hypothetical protein